MTTNLSRFCDRNSFNFRQIYFWSTFFLCLIFAAIITTAITMLFGDIDIKVRTNIAMVIQDLIVFILPAYLTARIITNRPNSFLKVNVIPSIKMIGFVVTFFLVSIPFINYTVALNESIALPDSMHAVEQWMRESEQAAKEVTDMMMSFDSFGSMILCIALVGLLTGFSEEIFFRGALQGIFTSRPINIHISIWFTAFMFSLLHFQFYGFVPRMLMGAMCGYFVYWSGSLWTSIIAHAMNNSMVVVGSYLLSLGILNSNLDSIGIPARGEFPIAAVISLALCIALIVYHKPFFSKSTQH